MALSYLANKFKTNVLGLKLGGDYVITVFSYPLVRTVFTSEEYDGRPNNFFIRLRCMGTRRGNTPRNLCIEKKIQPGIYLQV